MGYFIPQDGPYEYDLCVPCHSHIGTHTHLEVHEQWVRVGVLVKSSSYLSSSGSWEWGSWDFLAATKS